MNASYLTGGEVGGMGGGATGPVAVIVAVAMLETAHYFAKLITKSLTGFPERKFLGAQN
jgi:hypothetical protein